MPKPTHQRSVSFGDLTIHEHALGVGDNPSVSGGCPVALSPHRLGTYQIKVDEFEEMRAQGSDGRGAKKSTAAIKMDRGTRMQILVSNGCHEKDIAEAVRISRNIRHSRERSMSIQKWDGVHEVTEKALRKVTKPFFFSSRNNIVMGATSSTTNGSSSASRANGGNGTAFKNCTSSSNSSPPCITLKNAAAMAFQKERVQRLANVLEQVPDRKIASN